MIPIRPILLRPFVAYNAEHKHAFKLAARHFLRNLAMALNEPGHPLRWNEGGIAVSGEATLHMDDLYVQVSESMFNGTPSILYRSCKSDRDYSGNQNNFCIFERLRTQEGQTRFINHCKALRAAEQQRRKDNAHV